MESSEQKREWSPLSIGSLLNVLFTVLLTIWLVSNEALRQSGSILEQTSPWVLIQALALQFLSLVVVPSLLFLVWLHGHEKKKFFDVTILNLELRLLALILNSSALAVYRGVRLLRFVDVRTSLNYTLTERFSFFSTVTIFGLVSVLIFPSLALREGAEVRLSTIGLIAAGIGLALLALRIFAPFFLPAKAVFRFKGFGEKIGESFRALERKKFIIALSASSAQLLFMAFTGYLIGLAVGVEDAVLIGILRVAAGLATSLLSFLPSTGTREVSFLSFALILEVGSQVQIETMILIYLALAGLLAIAGLCSSAARAIVHIAKKSL